MRFQLWRVVVNCLVGFAAMLPMASAQDSYEIIIRGGVVYDGTGSPPRRADVGIRGDSIGAIADLSNAVAKVEVDARGKAVAPGFINMLSWATTSLIEDGRAQSDVRQGVTLEIMGEGWSHGATQRNHAPPVNREPGRHQVRHPMDDVG